MAESALFVRVGRWLALLVFFAADRRTDAAICGNLQILRFTDTGDPLERKPYRWCHWVPSRGIPPTVTAFPCAEPPSIRLK